MKLLGSSVALRTDGVLDPIAPDPGKNGASAWTPMLAIEIDGTARYLRIIDWFGGTGAKPDIGYVGATGITTKAAVPNLNALKRVDIFTAQTAAVTGIAAVVFDPPFATVPAKALPTAIPNVLAGPIRAELVAGTLTKTGCQVKVTQQALVTGLVSVLAGATVNVIAIEA